MRIRHRRALSSPPVAGLDGRRATQQVLRMSAGQLWLFPPPRPLVERLGEAFFHALPTGPGVYLMCGESEGVLYVGKARNLRKRLSSYRVANPERLPRRMVRLLYRVTRIEWDECPTEEAARHREEALICVLTPRFNAAGKVWPIADEARDAWKQRRAKDVPKGQPESSQVVEEKESFAIIMPEGSQTRNHAGGITGE